MRTLILALAVYQLAVVASASPPVFFNKVDVFDGEKLIKDTGVLVVDGTINEMGTAIEPPPEAKVIDGDDRTLLPGLIDCHTHVVDESNLSQAVMFGVTTELDMMSIPGFARSLRKERDNPKAEVNRADFYSAGAAITVAGGHGTQFGFAVPTLAQSDNPATFVRQRIGEGSDYIKIMIEDGSAYGLERPTLKKQMVQASIDAAHERDRLAVAHVSTVEGAQLAVDCRIDGLAHLFCESAIPKTLIEQMKQQSVFVIPTATVVSNVAGHNSTNRLIEDDSIAPLLTPTNTTNLKNTFPNQAKKRNSWDKLKANILSLHRAGVPILAGTDAPNPGTVHGASLHHELRLLVESGLSPQAALAAATSLPADSFKLKSRGRIAVGYRADLVLVDGNPTKRIEDTSRIVGVWKNGRAIDRNVRINEVMREKAKPKTTPDSKGAMQVADFESGEVKAEFGSSWIVSTDKMMGGVSTATMKVSDGGASRTKRSLVVTGTVQDKAPAFSGVMFSPGPAPMAPIDLSSQRQIRFWAKGDGATKQLMLFFQKRGFTPSIKTFKTSNEWQEHTFKIADFDGCDGTDIIGFWFGSSQPGEFDFQIDEVSLTQ